RGRSHIHRNGCLRWWPQRSPGSPGWIELRSSNGVEPSKSFSHWSGDWRSAMVGTGRGRYCGGCVVTGRERRGLGAAGGGRRADGGAGCGAGRGVNAIAGGAMCGAGDEGGAGGRGGGTAAGAGGARGGPPQGLSLDLGGAPAFRGGGAGGGSGKAPSLAAAVRRSVGGSGKAPAPDISTSVSSSRGACLCGVIVSTGTGVRIASAGIPRGLTTVGCSWT